MPKQVDKCVKKLLADPNFKAFGNMTRHQSAWSVCMSRHKEGDESCFICEIEDEELFKEAMEKIMKDMPQLTKNDLELNDYTENIDVEEKLAGSNASDEDLEKINKLSVKPVTKEEVAVYSALLIDDQVTRNATQYPREFQKTLLSLPVGEGNFIGAPFLFGDIKDHQDTASSQVGRIFDAWQVADEKGHYGVMGKIYILRSKDNKETIQKIDSGVLKEISISTKVEMPICSLCKQDIRACGHEKGVDGCYVMMTGTGFCGEVSLVAIPGSTKAKILNEDALKGYAKAESVEILKQENEALRKEMQELKETFDEDYFAKIEDAIAAGKAGGIAASKGLIKTSKMGKVNALLNRTMKSGVSRLLGKSVSKSVIGGVSKAVGGLASAATLMLVGMAGDLAVKAGKTLFKTMKKSKKIKFGKGFKFKLALSDTEMEELENMVIEFDETDKLIIEELGLLPDEMSVDDMDHMDEEQLDALEALIDEWTAEFEELKVQIEPYDEGDVIIVNEENKDGYFPVIEQTNEQKDEIQHQIRMVETLNDINAKIEKANEHIIKYAAKYVLPISNISGDPTPQIQQGMKNEDVYFLTDNFYQKVELLDRNLRSIEELLQFNSDREIAVYKGTMTQVNELTMYVHTKIEDILQRIYQLQGRFNLEEAQKLELIDETVRLGTIANIVKFENKEDVKKLFGNMTLEELKRTRDSFFTEGKRVLQNKEHEDDQFEDKDKKKDEPKDPRPVNVMDYKKKSN